MSIIASEDLTTLINGGPRETHMIAEEAPVEVSDQAIFSPEEPMPEELMSEETDNSIELNVTPHMDIEMPSETVETEDFSVSNADVGDTLDSVEDAVMENLETADEVIADTESYPMITSDVSMMDIPNRLEDPSKLVILNSIIEEHCVSRISNDRIILADGLHSTHGSSIGIITMNKTSIVPVIDGEVRIDCRSTSLENTPYNGLMFISNKIDLNGHHSIYTLIPSLVKGKKISMYFKDEAIYHVHVGRHDSMHPQIALNESRVQRDLSSELTETDRVKISSKFTKKKLAESWSTLEDAIDGINDVLFGVIDPNYITKLAKLNMDLSWE